MFVQYHDVVKPTYLMAVIKLLTGKETYGLPIDSIRSLSILSLIEWYLRRRYRNPLRSVDFLRQFSDERVDEILTTILRSDDSLYRLAPVLNIQRLLSSYTKQRMTFPVYVYTEQEEPYVREDCKQLFPGVPVTYLHGDLEKALGHCSQNFTYMLSDITLLEKLAVLLTGTCSHLLLASDYRYNYKPRGQGPKINLGEMMENHPFIRLETSTVCDPMNLAISLKGLLDNSKSRKET